MPETDPIKEELRKLVRVLKPHEIRLIIGGGYGLLLRTEHIQRTGVRTRFPEIPGARSTNDLDIFLSAEIITDAEKTGQIRAALDGLGYVPIAGAEYFQFVLPVDYVGLPRRVKIDLLAAEVCGERMVKVKADDRRIRPRKSDARKLHAHTTPEALTIEEFLLEYDVGGDESEELMVYLPHPFSYLILKLFASKDRIDDPLKGPYHAFDIYRVIAMMTEKEWDQATVLRDRFAGEDILAEAYDIVRSLFAGIDAEGIRLLRLYARSTGEEISETRLQEFIDDLQTLLPGRSG